MAQRFVGIDLGTHTVKIAVVTLGFRGMSVLDLAEVDVRPDDDDPLAAAVRATLDLMRAKGLMGCPAGVALPGEMASYRVLRFPFADPKRVEQAVGFEAEGQFPLPLDELEHDHVVVPRGQGGQALVVAVRRERLNEVASQLRAEGLDLKLLTVTPLALAQVVDPSPFEVAAGLAEGHEVVTLLVDIGQRATSFVALTAKGPVAVRTLRRGARHVTIALARSFGMDLEEAESAKISHGFLPHRGLEAMNDEQERSAAASVAAVEDLVRELERTRLWLRSSYAYEVGRIVLAGGGSRLVGMAPYLSEQLELPVGDVALRSTLKREGGFQPEDLRFAGALGTAVGAARRPLIQLYEAPSQELERGFLQERMATFATIGISVLAFGSLDTLAQVDALERERDTRLGELAAVSERVFGEVITNPKDVDERLSKVEGDDLTSLVPQRGALDVLDLIAQAAYPTDAATAVRAPPKAKPETTGTSSGGEGGDAAAALPPVTDSAAGILVDDELVFSLIEIREQKIELRAVATRSSAQERLALKLQQTGCMQNIEKGRVRDENGKKRFDVLIDSTCYQTASTQPQEGTE